MKRITIALLALALALAVTPAALADTTFYYNYNDPGVATASGTLSGTEIGDTGVYNITSGTIDLSYGGGGSLTGSITAPSCCGADNELYTLGVAPPSDNLYLDQGGLLFALTDGSLVNLWGGDDNGNLNGTSVDYSITQNNLDWVDFPGTFTISETPEPSSLLLLGTALFGLAFVVFKKAKASGMTLQS